MKLEFFLNGHGRQLIINDLNKGTFGPFTKKDHEVINRVLEKLHSSYPDAYATLKKLYNGNHFYMVRRFLKCNFSLHDNRPDVDDDFNFTFEPVHCPMKGECREDGIICNPKLTTELSNREKEVAELLVADYDNNYIADKLYISVFTVENHRRNIYTKLGIHSLAQLVNWWYKHYSDTPAQGEPED